MLGSAVAGHRPEATRMWIGFAVDLNHIGWYQFLYHPILLSMEQLARSGEKYLWSSLQHNDEREAAFEGGRTVDGAIKEVVSVAVVAIASTVALRVAGLVRVLEVFGELARSVIRNWQCRYQVGVWNGAMVAGRGTRARGSTPAVHAA